MALEREREREPMRCQRPTLVLANLTGKWFRQFFLEKWLWEEGQGQEQSCSLGQQLDQETHSTQQDQKNNMANQSHLVLGFT